MTEQEWLRCSGPVKMLMFLRGKASERKLRLFACACFRRVGHLCKDEWSLPAVETAERYAEGLVKERQLDRDHRAIYGIVKLRMTTGSPEVYAANAAKVASAPGAFDTASAAAAASIAACAPGKLLAGGTRRAAATAERKGQSHLLRCLFGNPFRIATLAPAVLAWDNGTVPKVARAIYDQRAFDRLPILADALEEAGCTDADILDHCRSQGEHARGCWVVDYILRKSPVWKYSPPGA